MSKLLDRGPVRLIVETSKRWIEHDAPTMSAAMAFYSLTSVAPILVIAVGAAGVLLEQEAVRAYVMEAVSGIADSQTEELLGSLVDAPWMSRTDPLGGALALITLAFASTAGFSHLRASLNRIWEVPKGADAIRSLVRGRVLSFALVLVIGLLVLASLLLRAALAAFGSFLEQYLPFDLSLFSILETAIFFCSLAALFSLIFRYLPDRHLPWRTLVMGAGATALLFVIGEMAIGFYLGRVGAASAFGAVGSVVVLALWAYYSCMVFLWGAEFTFVFSERARAQGIRA